MIEMNQDNIQQLRDKVADIKYDTQQVLNRIDSMDAAYQEQTGREQALERQLKELEEARGRAEGEVELLQRSIKMLEDEVADLKVQRDKARLDKVCAPTMPVIPKAVAIAIFREGMAYGAGNVCDELNDAPAIEISDRECMGNFEVECTQYVDLPEHLDLDHLRSKAVDNSDEEWVVEALGTLCADEKFECRIHGVDDQQTKDND